MIREPIWAGGQRVYISANTRKSRIRIQGVVSMRQLVRRPAYITVFLSVVGLWLIVAAPLLGLTAVSAAWTNAVVVGAALMLLAVIRHLVPRYFEKVRWMALALGGWLIASPYVAGYAYLEAGLWNAVVVGAVLIVGVITAVAIPKPRQAPTR